MNKPKIIRTFTAPQSLCFIEGVLNDLQERYDVIVLSSPGEEWTQIRELHPDIKCIEVRMERHISIVKDVMALWKLWMVFRREKPLMVHSMTPKAGLLCMMAAWIARVPIRIHTFTGLVFPTATGLMKKILIFSDWLTCACATNIIPEGEGVKKDLINNGITKKSIRVLGFGNVKGIDIDAFDPVKVKPLDIKDESLVTFISVGRLVGDKGINEIVGAFVRLNAEYSQTRLILVGPEERDLDPLKQETIDNIKRNSSIIAVGKQNNVKEWFASSDIAVLASYREGFPNVVIEAGAMGLPQIVTDINGANEIIVDGVNGTIIPPRDSYALYEAMKRMLDTEYRNKLSYNARSMIVSRYEQGFVKRCLLEYYDEIMSISKQYV